MSAPFQKTSIGTSAVQLTASTTLNKYAITVKALAANTGKVYVGLTGVTANDGFELSAGEAVTLPPIFAATADLIYAIASTSGQGVCVVVL